ncbi:MAG: 4Fe-4S binding protein [Synergistaceae bacterium]|jgi:NADH-quinone oxidoreductase subunit F|nr:4Fe-4S binding protein [Synergistaceae bacterium]
MMETPKLLSLDALREYRRGVISDGMDKVTGIWVCCGTGCLAWGSAGVLEAIKKHIGTISADIAVGVRCEAGGCHGQCERGPIVEITPHGWVYHKTRPQDAEKLVRFALEGDPASPTEDKNPFTAKQEKRVLSRMGKMSPTSITDYIRNDGYEALEKALGEMSPEEICRAVSSSGLRGRGGGGFKTGTKWEACRRSKSGVKYVLVNGDEGDPGAFMDRSLMEGDPHSVIEGLIIGGYAMEASDGYIYVRNEYPQAIKHLQKAIDDARELGLLGENILGTGFDFDIAICRGGGAFVCGESTALMASIEGRAGTPRVKYIRSTERGLWDKPTVLNNVETWANVPLIVRNGAEWFRDIGTEGSPGTKIFALVGKVENTGLVEVPMGTTLRRVIYDIGGGIKKKRSFKAVQTGGPSGGCLPESALDIGIDFDSLTAAGSMMGSGGMIVMDDRTCMVDVARYFIDFLVGESCGKCVPCREGVKKMSLILNDITAGRGVQGDVETLGEMARSLADTALCGLGQSAPNPVLSTIKYFREEYDEHVRDGFCRAGVCRGMFAAGISESCVGCGVCRKSCPVSAINGEVKRRHMVDKSRCIGCGSCFDLCPARAITPERRPQK